MLYGDKEANDYAKGVLKVCLRTANAYNWSGSSVTEKPVTNCHAGLDPVADEQHNIISNCSAAGQKQANHLHDGTAGPGEEFDGAGGNVCEERAAAQGRKSGVRWRRDRPCKVRRQVRPSKALGIQSSVGMQHVLVSGKQHALNVLCTHIPAIPLPLFREEKDQCELVHKLIEEHHLDGDCRWLVRTDRTSNVAFIDSTQSVVPCGHQTAAFCILEHLLTHRWHRKTASRMASCTATLLTTTASLCSQPSKKRCWQKRLETFAAVILSRASEK